MWETARLNPQRPRHDVPAGLVVAECGVLILPSKISACISECSLVVSPAPRAFPCGQGTALAFGLLGKWAFCMPLAHLGVL